MALRGYVSLDRRDELCRDIRWGIGVVCLMELAYESRRRNGKLLVKTLLKSSDMMYSNDTSAAIEDVMTTLLTDCTFAADFKMPTVASMAGPITSRL